MWLPTSTKQNKTIVCVTFVCVIFFVISGSLTRFDLPLKWIGFRNMGDGGSVTQLPMYNDLSLIICFQQHRYNMTVHMHTGYLTKPWLTRCLQDLNSTEQETVVRIYGSMFYYPAIIWTFLLKSMSASLHLILLLGPLFMLSL